MSSPQIRQIVEQLYRDQLEVPDQWMTRRSEFLEAEAARISRLVAELSQEMGEQAVSQWKAAHHGSHPDYMTHQGLINTARSAAMEIVLGQELYEQIEQPEESLQVPPAAIEAPQLGWEQRWIRSELRSEPDATLEDLAEQVWPHPQFSVMFRIKAGFLLAARTEDGLPLPARADDPLAAELTPLVYADLERDGHPRR